MKTLSRLILQDHFGQGWPFCPAHLPPATFYVDTALRAWYGAIPAETAAPDRFLTAWTLHDAVMECFTGEPSTLGRDQFVALADAVDVGDAEARYVQLRQDLLPLVPVVARRVGYKLIDGAKGRADQLREMA